MLKARLADARRRMDDFTSGVVRVSKDEWPSTLNSLMEECLAAERELAIAEHVCCAMPWSEIPTPDVGAPMPQLVVGQSTFLAYYVSTATSQFDGSQVEVANPLADGCPVALLKFRFAIAARMGSPNDEVLSGHPLYGRGLSAYSGHVVVNSPWIAEIQAINSVHHEYNPASWRGKKHYLIAFHDEMFECIASEVTVEIHNASLEDVLVGAAKNMFHRRE